MTLLIFMYIFSFKIYSFIDSSILVGLYLMILLLLNKNYLKTFSEIILTKQNFKIIMFIIFILSWIGIVLILNQTYDFSYLKTFLHFILCIFIGILLFSLFKYKNIEDKIVNYIIIAFFIQTIFQWICFLFPTFSEMFNYFRSENMIRLSQHYDGFRGIALSSSGFFSLSSSYGLLFLLYFTEANKLFKNVKIKIICFIFLITGTFFAGRTGYVALFLLPFLIFNKNTKITKQMLKIPLYLFLIISLCTLFFKITYKNNKISGLYNYSFELIKNFKEGNGFTSTSTKALNDMYNVKINLKEYLIGDGKYTINDVGVSHYYKNVDIGYYRKILFFGLVGLILSLILQCLILGKYNKKSMIILIYALILEFKGEIIGINLMFNSILILWSLCSDNLKGITNDEKKIDSFNDNL